MNSNEIEKLAHMHAVYMRGEYESNKNNDDCIITDFDGNKCVKVYYGNILNIQPSCKYYMPWTTNQSEDDIDEDRLFWETLKSELGNDLWVESGEGDALDIFICGVYEEPVYTHVRDIPDDYELITDSQDVQALCESISIDYDTYSGGCFLVLVGNGDYDSVYYCDHSVPNLDYEVEKIV